MNVKLTQDEEKIGYETLEKLGIKKKDKFVCLIVRDDNYLKTIHPDTDWTYHNYRDSNIKNYYLAAENLTNRGYYVIRMGSKNKHKINFGNKKIIDYSFSKFRSDFMDIFICSKCSFAISTSTGVDALCQLFRKPIVFVNFVPVGWLVSSNKNNVYLFKKHFSIKSNYFLSLKKIFDFGIAETLTSEAYEKNGIKLIENSPKEISDAVIELDDFINKKKQYSKDEKKNSSLFWEIYKKKIFESNLQSLHGKFVGRYSTDFLNNNKFFLK